ncbi:tyrosine-protein kinase RYK-like isoform X2 [Ruditapes philippinarum]|uniref:tyrosine-protein kinase RYK-like isoform X2 n=1 Tax=Ruditapes philippinarum TaxID=129788 RepID=UPI00295B2C79|nr:tyrosine-protein kinase RYK-like isoform X2 [Ruditapes philippinarum]
MTPISASFGLTLVLWIIPYSEQHLNLYLDEKETSRLLGIPKAELYYVRNGILNKYALSFNMPIPPQIDSIFFTWQNLRPKRPKPPDNMMFYKMRFKVSNPTAMNMPDPSIAPDGVVPTTLSTFKINFPCTGAVTTEVDVNIQMNISIFSASNVTVLDFRRKKFCTKVDTYLFQEVQSTPSSRNLHPNLHPGILNISHNVSPEYTKRVDQPDDNNGSSTHIFYIAVGCVCAFIIFVALAVAVYYVNSQKSTNRAYAERISDTSSSQALTQQTQSFLRADTPNKSLAGSHSILSVRSYPRGISPIPELRQQIPAPPIDPYAMLQEIAIDRSRISMSEVIMEGTFGKVSCGTLLSEEDSQVADQEIFVKTVTEQARSDQVHVFLVESCLMKGLPHPNIHPVIGACIHEKLPPYIIYPYSTEGNLKKFLQKCRISDCNSHYSLSTQQIVYMAIQVIRGIQFLHRKKIVHKDIAARNCVVESDLIVKLTDNSLARDLFPGDYNCLGDNENRPVKWLSIEAITERRFSPPSDVWSFGVVLWELVTLAQQPYPDIDPFEMAAYLHEGYRLAQPPNCPDEMYSVMACCWAMNPEERPKFSQLLACLQDFYTALGRFI